MPDALPEALVTYLIDRDQQRAQAVDEFLAKLTPRERALVTQIAVMGYVQGQRHPEGERIPKNDPLLAQVIDACFAFPDLYPAINTIARSKGPLEPVWQIETEQRGTWRQWVPDRTDAEEARAEYEQCVARNGTRWTFRLVRADTTRIIEAHHTPETAAPDTEEA